jgi:hypothetical protein
MEGVQVETQPRLQEAGTEVPVASASGVPAPGEGDHPGPMPPGAATRPASRHTAPFANIFDSPVLLPMLSVSYYDNLFFFIFCKW